MCMVPNVDRTGRAPRGRGATIPGILLLAWLLSLGSAQAASAQHIRGRLLDVETDAPIAGGILTLLSVDSSRVSTAVSDPDGYWLLDVPGAGIYHVAAERIGYQSWVSEGVEVGADDELSSVFHLQPAPVTLDPIDVRVRAIRQYLDYAGFFERQRGNFGHFVTPEAIERRQAANITDLLAGIPGVQRVPFGGGSAGPAQIQLRGSSLSQGGMCRPRVFVDGLMFSRGDSRPISEREGAETDERVEDPLREDQALSIDDIGHPSTIAAIEVYRSASQVPVQFGGTSVETLCGVIVIWTLTGRVRAGRR
ncbi:MAG TPA: carboxypeptidase regulatory-like domain-containing protein [Longimicrobiales bacterium]|nr:carboxypeptidase regulatory-like domain-containing protein [Longimicrobiales bacterium]